MKAIEAKKRSLEKNKKDDLIFINKAIRDESGNGYFDCSIVIDLEDEFDFEFYESIFKTLSEEGYDILYYISSRTVYISWLNSEEGRVGKIELTK